MITLGHASKSAIHCDLLTLWPRMGTYFHSYNLLKLSICTPGNKWLGSWIKLSHVFTTVYWNMMLFITSAIQGDLLTLWPYWMGTYYTTVMRGNSLICGPTETAIHCDLLTLWPQMGICIHLSHCLLKLPALIARSPSWSHWDMLLNQPYIVIYSLCGPKWGFCIHLLLCLLKLPALIAPSP